MQIFLKMKYKPINQLTRKVSKTINKKYYNKKKKCSVKKNKRKRKSKKKSVKNGSQHWKKHFHVRSLSSIYYRASFRFENTSGSNEGALRTRAVRKMGCPYGPVFWKIQSKRAPTILRKHRSNDIISLLTFWWRCCLTPWNPRKKRQKSLKIQPMLSDLVLKRRCPNDPLYITNLFLLKWFL